MKDAADNTRHLHAEAKFNVTYYKSVSLIPGAGATIKQAFQQASSVPFSLVVNDELAQTTKRASIYLLSSPLANTGISFTAKEGAS